MMNTTTTKIVCVGAAVLDVVMRVPRMPACDEKLKAEEARTCAGGNALNAAVGAARLLGARGTVALVCALGADALATAVLAECRTEGVEAHATLLPHTTTPLSVVIAADDSQSFVVVALLITASCCVHNPPSTHLKQPGNCWSEIPAALVCDSDAACGAA